VAAEVVADLGEGLGVLARKKEIGGEGPVPEGVEAHARLAGGGVRGPVDLRALRRLAERRFSEVMV
jgi:hypothetical protein